MILTEKPPIYERCVEVFGINWDDGVIFTYGENIYCKDQALLSPDLLVHEETHIRQQMAMGKDIWWDRYFVDKEFRLSQEVEAYKNQLHYIRGHYDRPTRKKLEKHIYSSMAKIYAGMCTEEEAKKLLNEN